METQGEKRSKTEFNSNIPSSLWQGREKRCEDSDEVIFSDVK